MNLIEERGYEGVRYEWHEDLQLLIVKVPTKAHEAASQEFGTSITDAVAVMGLSPLERRVLGAGRFHVPLGAPRKEPDWSMKTRIVRPNPDDFPTIVVEAGFSESLAKLRNDARLWFSISNNAIQIVILIAVRAARRETIIEKWIVAPGQPPQVPQAVQSITITETAPNTYAITAGTAPLIPEFNKLFLRQPVGQEQDIVYTQTKLLLVAEAIFDLV